MDQQPMRGAAPLEPPTPDVARRYLDEAEAVRERRNAQVDTRPQGWVTIVTGVLVLGFVASSVVVLRAGDSSAVSLLVFIMIATSQISSGVSERGGALRHPTKGRVLHGVALGLVCASAVASFLLAIIKQESVPIPLTLLPVLVGAVLFIAVGVVQLRAARGMIHPPRRSRPPFAWPARGTTLALGVLLSGIVVMRSIADPLLVSLFAIVAGAAILIASIGAASEWGLAHLGEVWRWPQYLMFFAGVVGVTGTVLLQSSGVQISFAMAAAVAGVLLVLTLAASLLGRRADDHG
ncbi:MAG: hypothetical protein P0Y60_09160 [Candidatus Microbacterium colombiense]|nr:MAG: hypothetical protein P0Y60_09160 [Microbacterium sp.]